MRTRTGVSSIHLPRFPYQIGLLGQFAPHQTAIEATIRNRFADLGLESSDYRVLIAAITGHRSLKEIVRYTRAADQKRLATAAMAKVKKGTTTV